MPSLHTRFRKNFLLLMEKIVCCSIAVALVCFVLFILLSTLSYNPNDPSWNTFSHHAPANLMGLPGSYIADFLIQTTGASFIVLCLAFMTIAIRLFREPYFAHIPLASWILSIPLLLILTSFFLSFLDSPQAWHIPEEMGGYLGHFFYNNLPDKFCSPLRLTLVYSIIGLCIGSVWLYLANLNALHLTQKLAIFLCRFAQTSFSRFRNAPQPSGKVQILSLREKKQRINAYTSDKTTTKNKSQALSSRPEFASYPLPLDLLTTHDDPVTHHRQQESIAHNNIQTLCQILHDFKVSGQMTQATCGPIVTLYEFVPDAGIKTSRIINLADDIARIMGVVSVRIAAIPGKSVIGIELPNEHRETVSLKKLLASPTYQKSSYRLPLILGKNISGETQIADLSSMPHLLIAGTTGSGKSVGINSMILSLLYALSPEECKFIMIDPKMLELSVYEGIPHLLMPVVTDPKKAIAALRWVVKEMENRYQMMSVIGVRNIYSYNEKCKKQPHAEPHTPPMEPMPYIVVIADEMADLMLTAGKEVEFLIQRLSQMARASGIHIIMATQRPSVDVITGTIKSNFPARISYAVSSKIDSRTILGESGAEQLLGKGDMLLSMAGSRPLRIHAPFATDRDIENVCHYLLTMVPPKNPEIILEDSDGTILDESDLPENVDEALYADAVKLIHEKKKVSISLIQRHMRIGYNRAARIIETMENNGIISTPDARGRRSIFSS